MLRVEDLELSCIEHTVRRAGRKIDLTPKEFALLEYLMRNAGHCVSRAQIIEHVWDLSFDTMTNVVDVYINYLRKKVDAGSAAQADPHGSRVRLSAAGRAERSKGSR